MVGPDRTFEAIVVDWDGVAVRDRRSAAAVRRRVEALCAHGVDMAVVSDGDDLDDRLQARPAGPGRLFLAPDHGSRLLVVDARGPRRLPRGPDPTDGCDPLPPLLRRFAERGVGPGLVLVVGEPALVPLGVTHLSGGPATLRRLLDEQLRRRDRRRVPSVDEDPDWVLTVVDDDELRTRARETLLSLGDGVIGLRGSHEEGDPHESPLLLASGVYDGEGPAEHLIAGPSPLSLNVGAPRGRGRRVLDLRTGVLLREGTDRPDGVRALRFVAAGRRGVVALRAEGRRLSPGPPLSQVTDRAVVHGGVDGVVWAVTRGARGGIAAAASQVTSHDGALRVVERVAAFATDTHRPPSTGRAIATLRTVAADGFDRLLAEHRQVWARRWADAGVWVADDPEAQRAARFALFHLWSSVAGHGEAAVGARGLSGTGYAGHVFWDADVFVLPAVAAMAPPAARAMLEYRIRRLPQARALARLRGLAGARFPWESASVGDDVTPVSGRLNGEWVPILTGRLEEHIDADVAWAASHYAEWTGDRAFLAGPGRALVVETARYWASRAWVDADGRAHLRHVIGPDEYHLDVDDDTYTNVMARWGLRRAAALEPASEETAGWLRLADALVDGYDPATGRHEQFAGYDALEPLRVADVGTPPIAADLLLGPTRTAASQVVKQPDVLMAHHLLPDEMPAGSLAADLDHYLPRTAHGSSLSPAITASLLARAHRPDDALPFLDLALRLDLDDLTGVTGSGLHLATLGGVWQALLFGFAGARVRRDVLSLDPVLPSRWGGLRLRFRCLGRRVELDVRPDAATVVVSGPIRVRGSAGTAVDVSHRLRLVRDQTGWRAHRR